MNAATRVLAFALVLSATPLYAAETKNIDKTLPPNALGAITLDAHNGSIQVRTWDRSELEIHVQIEARGTSSDARQRFQALDLSTHNGSIWVSNHSGPLALSMHNGDAHIDFASFTHNSRLETHNATVEVSLPPSSKFAFHSNGHNMHVDSDFPSTVRASDFGRHSAVGRGNGGGPDLALTAHNGIFRLRSK